MQHSYDALDRPGGFTRLNLLAPLRHRDFRLLWSGMTVSLLGDGIFLVAMAWQVYAIWNAPAALSMVGIAMTVPTIVCLLPGGVVSDRLSRRGIMLAADAVRAVAIAVLAGLSITGRVEIWEIAVLAMVYGAGTAFFTPAFEALVPDILPTSDLPAANSLDQFVRPIALRLAGPAVGGWLIAAFGPGAAFAADAASFVAAGAAVLAMRPVPRHAPEGLSVMADIRGGLRFIRGRLRLPALPRPHRGAPALRGQEQPARLGRHARGRLRRRRDRLDRRRGADGPARAAPPSGDVHLRGLDARDAGGRRLRPRHGD